MAYASGILKNFKIVKSFAVRQERYFGTSKVSLIKLIEHSMRVISVYQTRVMINSFLILLFLFFLKIEIFFLILPFIIFFFTLVIFLRSKNKPKKKSEAMKHIYLFLSLCLFGQLLNALNPVLDEAIFYLPNGKSYIETYILIPSSDITFSKNKDAKLQAKVEITMLFKQNEQIVKFDKYVLTSKALADSSIINFNLIDIKRNSLEYGEYDLEVSFTDLNNTQNKSSIHLVQSVCKAYNSQSKL